MIQLHKIYVQNFKGIYRPTVIAFENSTLTILDGPNGFGKTTIFDVIELCLRGKMERTTAIYDVTKKNSGHKKPFYQNKAGEDVLLKAWFKKGEEDHIIIKRLNRNSDGRINGSRPFRPDAWELFETYYTNISSDFDSIPEYPSSGRVQQSFIDNVFYGSEDQSLLRLYPLFNYLQQEDNIYFLRKDEEQKKNELSFLFQTQIEDHALDQVNGVNNLITSISRSLLERIQQLGRASLIDKQEPYIQLIIDKQFAFDLEDPFALVPSDQLDAIYQQLSLVVQELQGFVKSFSYDEYQKQQLKNQLMSLINNPRLLQSFVIQKLFEDSIYSDLRERASRRNRCEFYMEMLDDFEIDNEMFRNFDFDQNFISNLDQLMNIRNELIAQIGEIGMIVRELNNARIATFDHFLALNRHVSQPNVCPLCDTSWGSIEALRASFEQKTENLNVYNRRQQESLDQIEERIRIEYLSVIRERIENYIIAPENIVDLNLVTTITEQRGSLDAVKRIFAILELANIELDLHIINEPTTMGKVQETTQHLKETLQAIYDGLYIDEDRLVYVEIFTQYFNAEPSRILRSEQLIAKQDYITQRLQIAKIFSINVLKDRLEKIQKLESRIGNVKQYYASAIKEYKRKMIEKIKIPFYIYSGKILQHYQQGYGIFVDVKETTSRVRFLTDENTDHDIVHQLSSGQLAVVSLAFCLALNKVYETPQHFKFLAIDDPVQTLDDLNIHSFIELLRHEFFDYQMIISTHEEHIANYMAYKFNKFQFESNKLNVQQSFYESQI